MRGAWPGKPCRAVVRSMCFIPKALGKY
jgi:hypothetical protein